MKMGPTSANSSPARIVFLRTSEAKARLLPALSPGNVDKTKQAPVTAILGYDTRFFEWMPKLFAHRPEMADTYAKSRALTETVAVRDATLQGAYVMLAARAVGLDVGGCRASTTPRWTPSSSPTAASSRTSCATSATAIRPR
jgi:3-hydroxypropanoate dehydrogenase